MAGKFALILATLLLARTGANGINRVIDAGIDAKNPRTKGRQLPTGTMKKGEALAFSVACFVGMALCVFFINRLCLLLLPLALFMMWSYSYTKRFTWACHLVLGMTCGLAPMGAWLAVTGNFGGLSPFVRAFFTGNAQAIPLLIGAFKAKDPFFIPIFLSAANAFWVAGFDIIYGAQDVKFDRANGICSMPACLGIKPALWISAACHMLSLLFLLLVGFWVPHFGSIYYIGLFLIAALLIAEHIIVRPGQLKHVKVASYGLNEVVGIVFLVFAIAAVYWE